MGEEHKLNSSNLKMLILSSKAVSSPFFTIAYKFQHWIKTELIKKEYDEYMQVAIDRFEGKYAVCEKDDKTMINIEIKNGTYMRLWTSL